VAGKGVTTVEQHRGDPDGRYESEHIELGGQQQSMCTRRRGSWAVGRGSWECRGGRRGRGADEDGSDDVEPEREGVGCLTVERPHLLTALMHGSQPAGPPPSLLSPISKSTIPQRGCSRPLGEGPAIHATRVLSWHRTIGRRVQALHFVFSLPHSSAVALHSVRHLQNETTPRARLWPTCNIRIRELSAPTRET